MVAHEDPLIAFNHFPGPNPKVLPISQKQTTTKMVSPVTRISYSLVPTSVLIPLYCKDKIQQIEESAY